MIGRNHNLEVLRMQKIECARRHFAAISDSKVVYGVAKDYQSLYNLVTK